MRGPHGPQTQVHEGTCAIKVSMSCAGVGGRVIYWAEVRTDQEASGRACAVDALDDRSARGELDGDVDTHSLGLVHT